MFLIGEDFLSTKQIKKYAKASKKSQRQLVKEFIIEKIFDYLFSKLAESAFVEKVKTHYLSKINTDAMSLGDFFVALFQGIAGAVTA